MRFRKAVSVLVLSFLPCISATTLAQSQTTGRIAGTVTDEQGAVIVGAEVTAISRTTGEERKVITDREGHFTLSLLPSSTYLVSLTASGFRKALFDDIKVTITETTAINAELAVGALLEESVMVNTAPSLIQNDGPQRGRVVDSRAVSELPLAKRNFTQILALSPGTAAALPDNTAVGRNSQQVSVNGARVTHNNFQINGIDANYIHTNNAQFIAIPAPETIQEFKVQTSLYDSTFGRSGGGNIQLVTKSGSNEFHGAAYGYFRDDAFNANNPFLKAAGVKRPILKRNAFGGMLGGPIQKDKSFVFISYQGTRERDSLTSNVLIAPCLGASCLTEDRSEQTLRNTFGVPTIHSAALALLNVKLANGKFLIPTPQANGRYSGSAPSSYREDQFNSNVDYRLNQQNWLAAKFFLSNAPTTLALFGANVPGFGVEQGNNNRIISLKDVHIFSSGVINEARLGYNFIRQDTYPQEPVRDSEVGIKRSTANALPGLPLISIGADAGGVSIGTDPQAGDTRIAVSTVTAADVLSIRRGKHNLRTGAELRYYQNTFNRNLQGRGSISIQSFKDFLIGATTLASLGVGIADRNLRATDYNFFVQDDWTVSSKWTLNLGLRYELNLPPYDTRGRLATFDPAFYQPRLELDNRNP
ncbi:MAG: carboxypeptidase regulatory-like domain-containing protein, partial [Pyrinomonadaceae bacterium]|nr:carboxypeptidase regulatory-like domain-containing protein [Pyrinomonadaceae bacterium]